MASENSITGSTKVFGITGDPVKHSLSPLLHNRCIRDNNIDAVYVPLGGSWQNPADFRAALDGFSIAGVSVTIPHKLLAAEVADTCDDIVKLAGSANTLCRDPAGWTAYNTDAPGALLSLVGENYEQKLKDQVFILFGNGGTARGLLAALYKCNPKMIVIAGRNIGRVNSFRDEFIEALKTAGLNYYENIKTTSFDVIADDSRDTLSALGLPGSVEVYHMNTTSVGLDKKREDAPFPVAGAWFHSGDVCFDAVYTPLDTDFTFKAKTAGAEVVYGYEMLLWQGLLQMQYFYGLNELPAPDEYRALLTDFLGLS